MERDMRLGRLGRAVSMGVMLGGILFLAACPGDLEEAAEEATQADNAGPEGTLDGCLEECHQVATKQEADCIGELSEEEKIDQTSYDSPYLLCQNKARGDRMGCRVDCNSAFRGR
jgi:hypothetical protein